MPFSAETYVWPLRDMLVVTIHGTPDEQKQQELLATVRQHIAEEPDPRLLYILSQDAEVERIHTLLAVGDHEAERNRVAYAVSTLGQLEAMRGLPAQNGSSSVRIFSEITAAYSYLSG